MQVVYVASVDMQIHLFLQNVFGQDFGFLQIFLLTKQVPVLVDDADLVAGGKREGELHGVHSDAVPEEDDAQARLVHLCRIGTSGKEATRAALHNCIRSRNF